MFGEFDPTGPPDTPAASGQCRRDVVAEGRGAAAPDHPGADQGIGTAFEPPPTPTGRPTGERTSRRGTSVQPWPAGFPGRTRPLAGPCWGVVRSVTSPVEADVRTDRRGRRCRRPFARLSATAAHVPGAGAIATSGLGDFAFVLLVPGQVGQQPFPAVCCAIADLGAGLALFLAVFQRTPVTPDRLAATITVFGLLGFCPVATWRWQHHGRWCVPGILYGSCGSSGRSRRSCRGANHRWRIELRRKVPALDSDRHRRGSQARSNWWELRAESGPGRILRSDDSSLTAGACRWVICPVTRTRPREGVPTGDAVIPAMLERTRRRGHRVGRRPLTDVVIRARRGWTGLVTCSSS